MQPRALLTAILMLVPLLNAGIAEAKNHAPAKLAIEQFACSSIQECSECPAKVEGVVSKSRKKNYDEFLDKCREACNDDCDSDADPADLPEAKGDL